MMRTRKKLVLSALLGAAMMLSFAVGLVPMQSDGIQHASAAQGLEQVAISADGVNAVGDSYSIPVGADQGFSALGLGSDGSTGLLATGEVEWSLASDGSAALSAAEGGLVATVSALAEGEAGLYVATADGLVDLVNLELYDLAAGGKALSSLNITTPQDGITVYVEDGAPTAPLALTSEVNDPEDTYLVQYTYEDGRKATLTANHPPYAAVIPDVTSITGNTIEAAAASYSGYVNSKGIDFEFTDSVEFSVVTGDFDSNDDGLPDDPFAIGLGDGDIYLGFGAGRQIGLGGLRGATKAADLPAGGTTVSVTDPADNTKVTTVVAPAGLVQAGETGILLVMQGDTLTGLLGSTEAGEVGTQPIGGLVPGARYAEVSILISDDGGATYAEIDPARVSENPLTVVMEGLSAADNANVNFFSYPTTVSQGVNDVIVDAAASDVWTKTDLGTAVADGAASAQLTSLSLLAPFGTPGGLNVSSISPAFGSAAGGNTVTIGVENGLIGDNFVVFFGDNAATNVQVVTKGGGVDLTATVPAATALDTPADLSDVPVRVETDTDFDIVPNGYTYRGPTVTSITPASGTQDGGTDVQINGSGFEGLKAVTSVSLGGSVLENLVVVDDTYLTGTTTAHSAGSVDVVVALPNGFTGTLADGFTYEAAPPFITSIFPSSVFNDGGYTVRVKGGYFQGAQAAKAYGSYGQYGSTTGYFTKVADVQDPANDRPAANNVVYDDSHMDVLTPSLEAEGQYKAKAISGLYNLYVATQAYAQYNQYGQYAHKTGGDDLLLSNMVDFRFVDRSESTINIDSITPDNGPLEGGNTVDIAGSGYPDTLGTRKVARKSGASVGGKVGELYILAAPDFFQTSGTDVRVPITLERDPAGPSGELASTIQFDIIFDPAVVDVTGFARSYQTQYWYRKSLGFSDATNDPQHPTPSGMKRVRFLFADATPSPAIGNLVLSGADDQMPANFSPLKLLLASGDTDSNSQISSAEYDAFTAGFDTDTFNTDTGSSWPTFAKIDINGDGVLTTAGDGSQTPTKLGDLRVNVIATVKEPSTPLEFDNIVFAKPAGTGVDPSLIAAVNGSFTVGTPPEPGLDEILANAPDTDQIPGISFAEYSAWFGAGATQAHFDDLDTNNDGVLSLDDIPFVAPVDVYFGSNDETAISKRQATVTGVSGGVIAVVAPAGEREGAVDVRVELVGDQTGTLFAISRAASAYTQYKSAVNDGGYTYFIPTFGIDSFTPARGWVFGAEVMTITGTGFTESTVVTIGGQVAERVTGATQSETELNVYIPAIEDSTAAAETPADVTVTNPAKPGSGEEDTADTQFTYVRFEGAEFTRIVPEGPTFTGDVFTTAFKLDLRAGEEIDLFLHGAETNTGAMGTLNIPAFAGTPGANGAYAKPGELPVLGIARATKTGGLFATENLAGDAVPNAWTFDIHLFNATAPFDEISIQFTRPEAITLGFPVDDVVPALTTGDVGSGLMTLWSNSTDFDYVYDSQEFTDPEDTDGVEPDTDNLFQSQLLDSETTVAKGDTVTDVNVRIYSLGTAYSLRDNAAPPDLTATFDEAQDTRLNEGDAVVIDGEGLGHADVFILDGSDAKATVGPLTLTSQNEFGLGFNIPTGITPGAITVRVVPIPGGATTIDLPGLTVLGGGGGGILPALLAALAALLGLLAGGDGGGGGGTCFIATAAYGTPLATEIDTLRALRDAFLLDNALGTAFVDVYYNISPAIADVVAKSPALAAAIRVLLTPIIFAGKFILAMPHVSLLLSALAAFIVVNRRAARKARKS